MKACDVCHFIAWEPSPDGIRCGFCKLQEGFIQLHATAGKALKTLRNNYKDVININSERMQLGVHPYTLMQREIRETIQELERRGVL